MFGIDRLDKEKDFIVLFYNMGYMDTEVSLVKYSTINETIGSQNKTYEHIEVLGESSSMLGGKDVDKILMEMLIDKFNSLKEREGKEDIRKFPRVIKRLQKEVIKAKEVLSANKQINFKVNELIDYVSLVTVIERKELEEYPQSTFFKDLTNPIDEVLKKTGYTVD